MHAHSSSCIKIVNRCRAHHCHVQICSEMLTAELHLRQSKCQELHHKQVWVFAWSMTQLKNMVAAFTQDKL